MAFIIKLQRKVTETVLMKIEDAEDLDDAKEKALSRVETETMLVPAIDWDHGRVLEHHLNFPEQFAVTDVES